MLYSGEDESESERRYGEVGKRDKSQFDKMDPNLQKTDGGEA